MNPRLPVLASNATPLPTPWREAPRKRAARRRRAEPPKTEPTPRQLAFLAVIRRSLAERGFPPTIRELGNQFGISSPNGVKCHLNALRRKGLIVLEEGTARGITLVVPPGHCRCCGQPLPTDPTP